jgi:putative sterol carrier protein
MKISPKTLARIKKPITKFDDMAPIGNLFWQTCIDERVTVKEFEKRGMVPRPDSIETFQTVMQRGFNPKNAGNVKMTLQFNFSGQVEGKCYFTINRGKISSSLGIARKPDLTIKTPFEVWMDILTRKADGAERLMKGKYKLEGKTDLIMKMGTLFGKDE